MIVIQVFLHALLQYRTPQGPVNRFKIRLPDDATVSNVLTTLELLGRVDNLVITVNHRAVDETARLMDGDRLDVTPTGTAADGTA